MRTLVIGKVIQRSCMTGAGHTVEHGPARVALALPRRDSQITCCIPSRCRVRALMYMPSLAVLSLAAMSCADSAQDAGHEHAAEHEEEDDFKGCPTEIPVFEPGSRAQGDHFALRVLSAMPNEPERYTNTWNVELSALAGENTTAQITRGRTFMPIHGHDGRVEPTIRPLATPGQFEIDSLSFTMRGPWEAQFWLRDASMIEDYIVMRVCVAR